MDDWIPGIYDESLDVRSSTTSSQTTISVPKALTEPPSTTRWLTS